MTASRPGPTGRPDVWQRDYEAAARLARAGDRTAARRAYEALRSPAAPVARLALVASDLGVLDALEGDRNSALRQFQTALHLDGRCAAARHNRDLLQTTGTTIDERDDPPDDAAPPRGRVAIVSFLFNWPSTGGGIVHTVELATFLQRAGFTVKLFAFDFPAWGIGRVDGRCPFPVDRLAFRPEEWTLPLIERRLRAAVADFAPQAVLVTDAWNIKPYLAGALREYRVFLRMQAQECLCPLNNLRFVPTRDGLVQCDNTQPADSERCRRCLESAAATSGELHRRERALCRVGTLDYQRRLDAALREAEAVFVLNPDVARAWRPFCRRVEVVTWGMDPARFPPPAAAAGETRSAEGKVELLFAGLTGEFIKGFHVLREACGRLWERRRDFELVVTDDAPEKPEPFARYVGWQTQGALPGWYRRTAMTVVPTVVQDGLSRTSVEAMASGRPVVASRIGGLPFTVAHGETGLLCEPGDSGDLAAKLELLIEEAALRTAMGRQGRAVFEERFAWPDVIEREYVPRLAVGRAASTTNRGA